MSEGKKEEERWQERIEREERKEEEKCVLISLFIILLGVHLKQPAYDPDRWSIEAESDRQQTGTQFPWYQTGKYHVRLQQ